MTELDLCRVTGGVSTTIFGAGSGPRKVVTIARPGGMPHTYIDVGTGQVLNSGSYPYSGR